jgi:putative phosphoribosyl transferase
MTERDKPHGGFQEVRIDVGQVDLRGDLAIPPDPTGIVVFAHGSGSGRHSPRNRQVAAALRHAGLATLLFDLLTPEEEAIDDRGGRIRFDMDLLADRLAETTQWLTTQSRAGDLPIGYFGASTGAGAALVAAARRPGLVEAVVSRGGRPDLAHDALRSVEAPTLLIVGELDPLVIELNREAFELIPAPKELEIVPGASHLFEEPGTLEQVSDLAAAWFLRYLARTGGGLDGLAS